MIAGGPLICVHKPVAFAEGRLPASVVAFALHNNWFGPAIAVTAPGITVTVIVESSSHPSNVPNTVYVVVEVGVAVTELPAVLLNELPGDHVYVSAPLTVSVEPVPLQIEEGFAVKMNTGLGFTKMLADGAMLFLVQPLLSVISNNCTE